MKADLLGVFWHGAVNCYDAGELSSWPVNIKRYFVVVWCKGFNKS